METYCDTIIIINSTTPPEEERLFTKGIKDLIRSYSHRMYDLDDLGVKKLAYKVKGHEDGHYIQIRWCIDDSMITTEDAIAQVERISIDIR